MPGVMPRPELWEQQARNRRNTVLVIVAFTLLLLVLGVGADFFLWGRLQSDELGVRFFPIGTVLALGIALIQSLCAYYWGASGVLASTQARPADPGDPKEQVLINVVQEMRLASGLPMPKVYVVPDSDPNAFAVGRDPDHAAVTVTRGLLEKLDREELQGVIAHELGHIRNYDIRTMTLVAGLLGAVVLISDFARRWLWYGGGRSRRGRSGGDDGGGGGAAGAVFFVVWLVLIMIAPLLAQIMAFAVSRSREYDADASGVEFTRNPRGLASALRKIDEAMAPTTSIGRGAAHLCICDPMGRAINERDGAAASLFATHPPIQKRIAILEAMAGAGPVAGVAVGQK
jgi:heat shock protein HtpX